MRIEAVTLHRTDAVPALQWNHVHGGLNAVQGSPQSTAAVVEFLAHVLFGRPPANWHPTFRHLFADGEVVVQRGNQRYRLRRHDDGTSTPRLTLTALDETPADRSTIHKLVGGLSPTVLGALCAVNFRDPPSIARLLNQEFARGSQALGGPRAAYGGRRTAELVARRDLLAQELETRIAGERRVSKELDGRWRELDRLVRDEQQRATLCDERLRAVETALAETDARLRYRRLELNVQLRWHADEPEEHASHLTALDEQIARSRTMLAELDRREAQVRSQLAETDVSRGAAAAALVDQRAWLSLSRQLAADLTGEVSRLARAAVSHQCVCRDAHPRLRPIAETVERQLDVLERLVQEQHAALHVTELQQEVETLSRSQSELRRYLDNLLERRQADARGLRPGAFHGSMAAADSGRECESDEPAWFSAADAEQLEERRLELEQERFELAAQLSGHNRALRDLRAQRDTVERQRAALLSARSIEHVQRELADVQRKLEQAAAGLDQQEYWAISTENLCRASSFLAQLSDGELVELMLVDSGRRARVATRSGETSDVEALPAAQRDVVCLSLCLGLLASLAQRGIWLPLVLEDPFLRLDARGTAALTVALDDFCRRGHQVLLFTDQPAAIKGLHAIGAAVREIDSLQQLAAIAPPAYAAQATGSVVAKKPKVAQRRAKSPRKKSPTRKTLRGEARTADQSDAA